MKTLRLLLVLVVVAGAASGCARSINQMVNDWTLTASIKRQLAATEGVGTVTGIDVDTYDDWVELNGTVRDEAQKERIDRLVRNLAGANRVRNNLMVSGGTTVETRAR